VSQHEPFVSLLLPSLGYLSAVFELRQMLHKICALVQQCAVSNFHGFLRQGHPELCRVLAAKLLGKLKNLRLPEFGRIIPPLLATFCAHLARQKLFHLG
jgi:hypothetical protein